MHCIQGGPRNVWLQWWKFKKLSWKWRKWRKWRERLHCRKKEIGRTWNWNRQSPIMFSKRRSSAPSLYHFNDIEERNSKAVMKLIFKVLATANSRIFFYPFLLFLPGWYISALGRTSLSPIQLPCKTVELFGKKKKGGWVKCDTTTNFNQLHLLPDTWLPILPLEHSDDPPRTTKQATLSPGQSFSVPKSSSRKALMSSQNPWLQQACYDVRRLRREELRVVHERVGTSWPMKLWKASDLRLRSRKRMKSESLYVRARWIRQGSNTISLFKRRRLRSSRLKFWAGKRAWRHEFVRAFRLQTTWAGEYCLCVPHSQ